MTEAKAGLLLFIRNHDVTTAIKKAVDELHAHPHFAGDGEHAHDLRHDVVLTSALDPAQQIRVALLPFAIPTSRVAVITTPDGQAET